MGGWVGGWVGLPIGFRSVLLLLLLHGRFLVFFWMGEKGGTQVSSCMGKVGGWLSGVEERKAV